MFRCSWTNLQSDPKSTTRPPSTPPVPSLPVSHSLHIPNIPYLPTPYLGNHQVIGHVVGGMRSQDHFIRGEQPVRVRQIDGQELGGQRGPVHDMGDHCVVQKRHILFPSFVHLLALGFLVRNYLVQRLQVLEVHLYFSGSRARPWNLGSLLV